MIVDDALFLFSTKTTIKLKAAGDLLTSGKLTLDYGDGSGLVANIGFGEGVDSLELDLSKLTDAGLLEHSLSGEDIDLGVSGFTGDITFIVISVENNNRLHPLKKV